MPKNTFLRGAMVLTMAGIVVKILGGMNRILLSRLLGGEGIGLYQMAYPVYILLLSIAGAGIPIAVSIMIAEQAARGNYSGVKRIFHVTTTAMFVIAVLCGLGMAVASQALVQYGLIRDQRALSALLVLSPALAISIMTCCFRGYFQGLQLMTPTAVSQMVDQFVRVCTMLTLAWLFLPYGLEKAAAGAAFGAVPGAIAGLAVIAVLYYRHSRQGLPADRRHFPVRPVWSVLRRLAVLAIPVAAANMLLPAVSSIDVFIVPQRLEAAGYSVHEVTTMFGYLTGMANGLVQLPAILTIALATSLVPAVSAAYSGGEFSKVLQRTHTAMRIANTITIPACFGLAVLAAPISQLLYATAAAGPAISVLSAAVFLVGVQQITSGLLQGMGHTGIPLFNMVIAAVVKIVLSWHLTAIPWLAEVGAAWATNADLAVAAALNLYFAHRYIRYSMQWSYLGRLFLAAAAMAGTAWLVYNGIMPVLGNALTTILAMTMAGIVYIICLFVFRAIAADDVARIPVLGRKLSLLVRRLGK
ncbi:MAG: polysaccharide biosynthesis protein [Megasphaera sp.]|nr:polysaccharide biosynthesis protein [Megasphaera sp.]MCH4187959.1 polysaccharide biosynthesis protein [Megasphaera sp.]MCH4217679.1 polysaccharide biosynthesis protein [Megasphaera sp.]